MANELIIDYSSSGEKIALLRDKKLIELHEENFSESFSAGDLYVGTVKKFKQELNAAFVDVGYHKDAFLHYHDLGPNIRSLNKLTRAAIHGSVTSGDLSNFRLEPETVKTGRITDVLKKGQKVLVQILKEPISSKGPRLSTEISIPGKYFIMVPFIDSITVSKKIEEREERQRLKNLAVSLKGPKYGLICRTAAQGRNVQELHRDLIEILKTWENVIANLKGAKGRELVFGENSRSQMVLRDLLSEEFSNIVTNDKYFYDEMHQYLQTISPNLVKVLKLYKGKENIFSQFGVDKQIKACFGKTVALQGGGYLIIEHTEAMHVIDVNSGSKQRKGDSSYSLAVNVEAAKEIARQLRLRDMGGIIVIDFIDLRDPKEKRALSDALRSAMESDRAKHTILPMSKFGLIQITRQRVRPEMNIITSELCPMCKGTGKIEASILLADEIEQHLHHLMKVAKVPRIELVTHPYVEAFFRKGPWSKFIRWSIQYRGRVKLTTDPTYHYGEYRFFDQNSEEIVL